ncbi:DNA polymerase-3 subunit gamma/tau [Caloramator quimbayensis]|uniref:DNA-directed DNA polymerase n=1 Tax=Caloramator quimbayensis TaxID=1147123 RepID=A0A1T4Y4L7_9CLOT|nr:DNA polymerase III subunit gamma/tau [Caloramator quimbayensis]SKA96747.1 DNA polymerase-3 subunit gamma/tau [Caloramator quimbayensis]
MSYTALYRELRPKIFEDVIGQENIIRTIKNQVISGRIPHAYLFCGTHGTGKTSTAKILSKAVNCLSPKDGNPCNECEICREINSGTLIDVVEIDAASNRKVENARDLIDTVQYPPQRAKYKVYIVDEVHMLTTEAFNTLLKTLEEPPSYVIFILATTDPQKVPTTILSRCQRFDFKRIKSEDMVKRLRKIVDENGILAEDRTLKMIARFSDGAMRDALSILDQAMSMSQGKIEYNDIISMLGLTSNEFIFSLTDSMIKGDVEESIKIIDNILLGGKDVNHFITELTMHFRNLLMVKISKRPEEIIDVSEETISLIKEQSRKIKSEDIMRAINILSEAENNSKYTSLPRIFLEMAVIKYCRAEFDTSPETILSRINMLEEKLKSKSITIKADDIEKEEEKPKRAKLKDEAAKTVVKKDVPETAGKVSMDEVTLDEARGAFQDVLNLLRANRKMVLYAYLAPGDVIDVKENNIIIGFDEKYAFSKKNIESSNDNKNTIDEYYSKVLNKSVKVALKIIDNKSDIDKSIELARDILGEDIIEVIE